MKRLTMFLLMLSICATAHAQPANPMNIQNITSEDAEQLKQSAIEQFNQGKYQQAIPLIEKALKLKPGDPVLQRYMLIFNRQVIEPYCKQAADAYLEGDYSSAIKQWESILMINPSDMRVSELIADTITASEQDSVKSLYDSINKLLKDGMLQEAVSELEKILLISPDDKRASDMLESTKITIRDKTIKEHYENAELYLQQNQYNSAIDEWNKVLEIDPNQDLASRLIASVHRKKLDEIYSKARDLFTIGDYISARDQYNKIISENPADLQLKATVAKLGDVVKVAPKITEQGRQWDIIRKSVNHYISQNGDPKVAIAGARYAYQLDPENMLILAVKDFIEDKYTSLSRTIPTPIKDMDIIEQYLFSALNNIYDGKYDVAIQECSLILELDPSNVLALKRLGSAYFAMGRKSKAKEAWERALELSPGDSELSGFIKQVR